MEMMVLIWVLITIFTNTLYIYMVVYFYRVAYPKIESNPNDDIYQGMVDDIYRRGQNEQWLAYAESIKRNGCVYIIQECGLNKLYKIGKTYSIRRRISHLETAMPYPMRIICILPSSKYDELELVLHREFKDKRQRLEWFELSDEDIDQIKRIGENYGQ